MADIVMEETYITDQEKALKDALWQMKQEQLDQEYQKMVQKLTEAEKMGAAEDMQEALQELDTIRRGKKRV